MPTNLTGLLATRYSVLGDMILGQAQVAWQRICDASDSATFTGLAGTHSQFVGMASDAAILSGAALASQDDPVLASSSAQFTSTIAATVARVKSASDSAAFTEHAVVGVMTPVSSSGLGTYSSVASAVVGRPGATSDSAGFSESLTSSVVHTAHDMATMIGTATSRLVHHATASDSITFIGVADGFDPFLHEFAASSARFSDLAATILAHGDEAVDSAVFSDLAAVIDYAGRFRRGDKVKLKITTPVTPDGPPIAVILDGNNSQVAAIMMPAANQPRTFFIITVPIGLSYGVGSFQVHFHYTIQGTATMQRASFDVVPGGDSGGSVIALYSLDRIEARCIVAQLDSGVLVVGKTPTVA